VVKLPGAASLLALPARAIILTVTAGGEAIIPASPFVVCKDQKQKKEDHNLSYFVTTQLFVPKP
jgi:hypothetical protein